MKRVIPMARKTTPLTDTEISKAKPKAKEYKLFDGGGLYLSISPKGGKWWRLKYLFENKEYRISLGTYPSTPLKEARKQRDELKEKIALGINPSSERKAEKLSLKTKQDEAKNTLSHVADEFFMQIIESVTPKYHKKLRSYYDNHVKAPLGTKPIKEIQRVDILSIVDTMQDKGIFESTKKTINLLERIYKYAIVREYVEHNIVADFDKKIVIKKRAVKHHAFFKDDNMIKILLEAVNNYQGEIVTKYALKIIPYLAVRPIELRSLRWEYINFKDNLITIPADKMKMRKEHLIPMTSTVKKMIQELQEFTSDKPYLFANAVYKDRYMSENTINVALRRMGFSKDEIVSHGFRSMFSTIANEKSPFSRDVIDTQLAHSVGSSVSQAYNRAKYLDERVELMQWWSDYLDEVQR
ncbi:integrase arm-type DNA-binding domain-containing protein [Sulfurimonas sp. NW15]|uniref:tyrosine-type recombinase/integrase n=1 Tax=Sulfurimonas TaxID=202746 RepID=UPI00126004AB|nr:integrase arm-type DNA-binding domain-containing protein [Sulfurimonas hydrogeniphila]